MINLRSDIGIKEFINRIDALEPSMVGFSCISSNQLEYLVKYSKALAEKNILQLAGGVCATLNPEEVLSRSAVKGVCIGEGEVPLENLFTNIAGGKDIFYTEGFYWNTNGQVKKNPVPQYEPNLSNFEFPDYTIFDDSVVCNRGIILVLLSRGCPYSCTYCCNAALKKVYPASSKYFRVPSVEYSIEFLKKMIIRYPQTKFIEFEDDLLISNKRWFENFASEYKKRINIPYSICARPEYINKDIVKCLKNSGCEKALVGLESGNERLRRDLLNRNYSNELFIEKAKIIKDAGIELFTFNMVGFPFETKEEMQDTLELNRRAEPDTGFCTFFYPYKGTELYALCDREGLLKDRKEMAKITNYNTKPAIKLTSVKEKECIKYQKKIMSYLVMQLIRYNYKKSHRSYLYLWFEYYAKPRLIQFIFSRNYLFFCYSKIKSFLYYKKTRLLKKTIK